MNRKQILLLLALLIVFILIVVTIDFGINKRAKSKPKEAETIKEYYRVGMRTSHKDVIQIVLVRDCEYVVSFIGNGDIEHYADCSNVNHKK